MKKILFFTHNENNEDDVTKFVNTSIEGLSTALLAWRCIM